MNRVWLAAAACGLLLTVACSAGPVSDAAQQPEPLASSETRSSARPPTPTPRTGNQKLLDNGLTVTFSAPKSFTPTEAATPRAPRAVAFDLIIENGSGTVYRPAQLSITAVVNGENAAQVVDSTQGYTGFVGPTDEVPPGKNVRVAVAFAVPLERADLVLVVQPDTVESRAFTVFEGTV